MRYFNDSARKENQPLPYIVGATTYQEKVRDDPQVCRAGTWDFYSEIWKIFKNE